MVHPSIEAIRVVPDAPEAVEVFPICTPFALETPVVPIVTCPKAAFPAPKLSPLPYMVDANDQLPELSSVNKGLPDFISHNNPDIPFRESFIGPTLIAVPAELYHTSYGLPLVCIPRDPVKDSTVPT